MKRLLPLVLLVSAGAVHAQSIPQRPNPPAQICVNATCVTTPSVSGAAPGQRSLAAIKWNPGHYMASDSIMYTSATLASVQAEMDDINGYDNIVGYRVFITWGALEPSQGNYDFSLLDAILNRLQTHYNKPKHLVVVVLPGPFGSRMHSGDASVIPQYLQSNSAYGPSPVAGSYGWWGRNSGGASTGSYAAALYRPAVMDRYIALVQALGAHYDNEPYFEGLMFQEDAWMVDLWTGAPDYSDTTFVNQLQRLLTAATIAFPHTSVIMENTWTANSSNTQNLELWMVNNRIAPGTADTVGQTAFNMGYASNGLNWGLQAYMGLTQNGSSYRGGDLRPRARAMLDIEPQDIAGDAYANYGAPEGYQPSDIINALNLTYQASHAFWTHFFGSEDVFGGGTVSSVASWAIWKNLAPVIDAKPLTNTSYPANYP